MINKLINYLNSHSLDELREQYKIKVTCHPKYPNLYLFKYNQIESDFSQDIVKVCRGIILDKNNNWYPVCYTYRKFHNYSEQLADKIDWSTAKIFEKLDGSLMQLFYYDGQWQVSTSGTPDADCQVNSFPISFKDLFWKIWNELGYILPKNKNICYAFELCTPFNRIVVQHKENKIVLHGARDLTNLRELSTVDAAKDTNWVVANSYNFSNAEQILEECRKMKGIEQEGYVVVDENFNRVKIKSEDYIRLHHCVSNMTARKMLEIVRQNEGSEFLQYFPEWVNFFAEIKQKYNDFINQVKSNYEQNKHLEDQKEFAMSIKHLPFAGALFMMKKGKIKSFEEFYVECPIKRLEELLSIKEVNLVTGE